MLSVRIGPSKSRLLVVSSTRPKRESIASGVAAVALVTTTEAAARPDSSDAAAVTLDSVSGSVG